MPFTKGQSGNPTGKRKGPGPETLLPAGTEDELAAMRHVMSNSVDETYQHWSFRQWLKDDPEGFRKTYSVWGRAERTGRASPASLTTAATASSGSAPSATPPVSTTPPEETPERIIEQLGESWVQAQEYLANRPEFLAWQRERASRS